MKKTINLIVTAVLVLSLLTACSSKDSPVNNTGNGNRESNNATNTTSTSQIDVSNISTITDFSNGLAFVQYNNDKSTYCIDKTGAQLFELKNCNIYNFAKFNNKVAIIETTNPNEYIICDKQGKIYKPEDFGASRIVLDTDNHKQAFLDGFIILEQREESYTDTKIEMSIIDSDFTTLVPFSAELAEIINSDVMSVNGTGYYDKYLYNYDLYGTSATILDLKTGAQLSDTTQMEVSTPLFSYWANGSYGTRFEHLQWGDIYNELTGEVVANVKENESISNISFVGNMGLATYDSDNGIWFNIIEQNGTAKFQPIKAESANVRFDGETILVVGDADVIEKESGNVHAFTLKTYDVNGNLLGEIVAEGTKYSGPSVTLNDGVIRVYCDKYLLYNSALEELF